MSIITKLEEDALKFMAKRLSIELSAEKQIVSKFNEAKRKADAYIKSFKNINLLNIEVIMNNIKNIVVEQYFIEINSYIEDFILNNMESGFNQGNRFASIANIEFSKDSSEDKSKYLLLLLNLSRGIINNFKDDFTNAISKNLYNMYVLNNNEERNSDGELGNSLLDKNYSSREIKSIQDKEFETFEKRVSAITKTEIIRALNVGILVSMLFMNKNNPNFQVRWVEVKDNRLCKYCREMANGGIGADGIYDFNSITPPPLHPNCRCVLVPYLSSWS